ncbi:putative MFS family arabinose efflux permease [Microterricola gilva]|uniref:Putative MFS family arabinose efflux permease n=1 Tax=Microterricola gilva TaxID=393267 RepID=A0A4Q8AH92_9MICO|nr:MFS transporter [Microterricola gilva]RZU63770.1 putative MFS family arabinose efflux permease [Microterricola gilva]
MSSTLAVPATGRAPLPSARLPLGGLLALAAVVFTGVVTEILPAGLLPQMSADLGISDSQVGALVAVYAIATAVTAIPLTALTRALPRRTLLVSLVLGFALVNAVTALAPSYAVILVARVIGGMLAGLLWAMAAGYAMRMVAPERAGRALSIAMVGTPLAFAFGLPIATALGSALGWREAFGAMAVLSLGLALWAALALPSFPGERAGERPSLLAVLRMPGLAIVLAATGAFVLAHNVAYTYIAPLTRESGLSAHLDVALLVFGVLAVGGVLTAGALVDRHLRGMVVIAAILLGVAMLAIGLWGGNPVVVFLAIGLWGFAYGGAPTLFQSAPARIAGSSADVAQSMVVATWNGSIAIGAFLGGVALDAAGVWLLPWLTITLLALAAGLALSSRAAFARVH